nr:cation acetate symporter [Nakamurella alba]
MPSAVAVGLVVLATVLIGAYGQRLSRTTGDFLVASRMVGPTWNAAAISGEYLSAASFLGVAALIVQFGADALWYPIGFTAGYLALLLFVAAPLRRSGAYTVPDFAQIRWGSLRLRRLATVVVLVIVWLYLVPQLHGAGLLLQYLVGVPRWVGVVGVALVVTASVVAGGMRSITFVQAFQYWLKLSAVAVPVVVMIALLRGDAFSALDTPWAAPGLGFGGGAALPEVYSVVIATFLGTMGLPHVLVRFYTNSGGGAARRTTVQVITLLVVFYFCTVLLGLISRSAGADPAGGDLVILGVPARALDGSAATAGTVLAAMIAAGAVAAFLSASSGLLVAAAGVISTDVLPGRVRDFRVAAVLGVLVPVAVALGAGGTDIVRVVGMAFGLAASTFCPLLVLGIWWRGVTVAGAAAGMLCGGGLALGAVTAGIVLGDRAGRWSWLLEQPAVISVPVAFAVMIGVSLATRRTVRPEVDAVLARLHLPGTLHHR